MEETLDLEALRLMCLRTRGTVDNLLRCLDNMHHAGTPGWQQIFAEETHDLYHVLKKIHGPLEEKKLTSPERVPDKNPLRQTPFHEPTIGVKRVAAKEEVLTPLNPDHGLAGKVIRVNFKHRRPAARGFKGLGGKKEE